MVYYGSIIRNICCGCFFKATAADRIGSFAAICSFSLYSAAAGENGRKKPKLSQFILNEDRFDLTNYDNFHYILSYFACQSDAQYSLGQKAQIIFNENADLFPFV